VEPICEKCQAIQSIGSPISIKDAKVCEIYRPIRKNDFPLSRWLNRSVPKSSWKYFLPKHLQCCKWAINHRRTTRNSLKIQTRTINFSKRSNATNIGIFVHRDSLSISILVGMFRISRSFASHIIERLSGVHKNKTRLKPHLSLILICSARTEENNIIILTHCLGWLRGYGLGSTVLNGLPLEQPNSFCNDMPNDIGVLFWMAVTNSELGMRFPTVWSAVAYLFKVPAATILGVEPIQLFVGQVRAYRLLNLPFFLKVG